MQKSTDEQLDETVVGKIETTVPRTVRSIFSKGLHPKAFRKSKRRKSKITSSVSNANAGTISAGPETPIAAIANTNNQLAAPFAPTLTTSGYHLFLQH